MLEDESVGTVVLNDDQVGSQTVLDPHDIIQLLQDHFTVEDVHERTLDDQSITLSLHDGLIQLRCDQLDCIILTGTAVGVFDHMVVDSIVLQVLGEGFSGSGLTRAREARH